MRIVLSVPASNERGPLYMDQALAAIHRGNPHRLGFCLGIARVGEEVSLIASFPPELRSLIEGQFYAQYPESHIETAGDPEGYADQKRWTADLSLSPELYPIRRYSQFDDGLNRVSASPLSALLTTIAREQSGRLQASIEILARPAHPRRRNRAIYCMRKLASPFFQHHHKIAHLYTELALSRSRGHRMLGWLLARLAHEEHAGSSLTTSASHAHEREEDLQAASHKLSLPLFEAAIRLTVCGPTNAEKAALQKLREMIGTFGIFGSHRLASFDEPEIRRGVLSRPRDAGFFLLSTEELATLWHPPMQTVQAERMARVECREFEPPARLPTTQGHVDLATLGTLSFRSRREPFGILPDDRLRHLAILGKTGMGKSTLIYNLILSDISAGRGVALIDPHGDLAESLLPALPRARTNDVILFDAGDASHPLGFNPFYCPDATQRPLVASGILSAFKKLFADSWGPRLEHILRNALLALLETPGTSLVSILRLLSEPKYRKQIVSQLTDPIVRRFWESEFASMPDKLRLEAISPIQNKVGHFVSSPLLRNILAQPTNRLELRRVMDDGKILIVNLSKGRIGEDSSMLLGALLITSLQIAAMSRADMPEAQRRPFHLYVDEFQNFATDAFATILSEARKYRLSLTLANQYLDQVEQGTAAAVFGNVGSLLCFQVGANDAEILTEQLGGGITPQDLMTLPRYQAYARLLIDGQPSRPFSMRTLPPSRRAIDPTRAEIVRRYSRQRYGRSRASVEGEIRAVFR